MVPSEPSTPVCAPGWRDPAAPTRSSAARWMRTPRVKRSKAHRARRSLASLILVGPSGTQLAHTESGWVCGMCMHSLHASSLIARPMNNVNYHFASLRRSFLFLHGRRPINHHHHSKVSIRLYKSNTGQRDNQDASLMMRNGVDDGRARRRYGLVVSHDNY